MSEIIRVPYLVDPHVHFRTPGQEHKEDFLTGSSAALAGGVTMVADMPNNSRLVTNRELLQQKRELAAATAVSDIGFYLGTLGEKEQDMMEAEPDVLGVKVYMNETTGHYVVKDPEKLDRAFREWKSEKPVLVHAEGDVLQTAIDLAERHDRRLYVCHTSLAKELDRIRRAKDRRPGRVYAEVTPHHLAIDSMWSADPYKQMKPPLSGLSDRMALWEALRDGTIDVVATDHAPHTKEEKESGNPPSGVTGLETTLAILLMAERAGWISMNRIREVTHDNPINIFNFPEQPDTFVEVERGVPWEIRGEALKTKCHTTPFEGMRVLDKVRTVTMRGNVVYDLGKVIAQPGSGQVIPK